MVIILSGIFQHILIYVIHHESGQSHPENRGYMRRGAVYLGFGGIPHAVIPLTFMIKSSVRQHLVIIDTQELVRRESPGPLQFFRRAAPSGQPLTCQNSATFTLRGSVFNAAPSEQKNLALLCDARRISNALSFSESIASIT